MVQMLVESTRVAPTVRTPANGTTLRRPTRNSSTVARSKTARGRTSGRRDAEVYWISLAGTVSGRLEQPVPLLVRHTEAYTAVAEPESGIYGAGASLDEALSDFWTAMRDYRDVLGAHEHLSPNMSKLLSFVVSLTG